MKPKFPWFHDIAAEAAADATREIWTDWMRHMFDQGEFQPDGSWLMPADKVACYRRIMDMPDDSEWERPGDC